MIQDVRYGKYVDPRVAGRTPIKIEELETKLGPAAYLVWRKLLWCRNEAGVTHATGLTLATGNIAHREWETLTKNQVKRATAKLVKVGMLRNLGWRRPSGRRTNILRSRVVFGAFIIDADQGELAVVPRRILPAIKGLGRGGKREGAGRPKKSIFLCSPNNQSGQHNRSAVSEFKAANITPLGVSNMMIENGDKDSFLKKRIPPASGGVFLSLEVEEGSRGSRVSGDDSSRPREDDRLFGEGIPKFPDSSVVEPPRVPHPAALDGEMSDREIAEAVAQAYRVVVSKRSGKACWMFSRGDIEKSKHYSRLVAAGRAMVEHELRPICWIAWCIDGWAKGHKKTGAPLPFIINAEKIHKQGGWCRKESADYLGGRLVPGDALRELWRRYMAMRADLVGSSAPVAEVINNHFPGRTYQRLVAAARQESARIQDDLRSRRDRGEFLW